MEVFGFEFQNLTNYWSSVGGLQVLDIQRQMYDYDSIQKNEMAREMYETQVNPLDSLLDQRHKAKV